MFSKCEDDRKNYKLILFNCFLFFFVLLFIFCLKFFSRLLDDYIILFYVYGYI